MVHVTLWKNLTNPFSTDHVGTDGFCNVWKGDVTAGTAASRARSSRTS